MLVELFHELQKRIQDIDERRLPQGQRLADLGDQASGHCQAKTRSSTR